MQHITILDYILLPLYLALFSWRVKKMSNAYADPNIKKYLFVAFGLRMFGSVAYAMLVQYYYGYGDSFTYYMGSNFFREQINTNLSNISYLFASFKETTEWYNATSADMVVTGYFDTPANNMVMRISAMVSYLSFNGFLIISLFFGFFSFLGQWKLFLVFDDINKNRNTKLLAYAILYSPSIWFWGSGLMKDSISLGALGFIIYILYQFFVKKKFSFFSLLSLIFLIYLVSIIKSYAATILFVSLGVMLFSVFLKSIRSAFLRLGLILLMISLSSLIFYTSDFSSEINDIAIESISQIETFKSNYEAVNETEVGSKGGVNPTSEIDASLGSLILSSPGAIFSCLYRPFLWESRSIFILFTSLESMLLLSCTIFIFFKTGIFGFFKKVFNTPVLLFCFSMSMLFALIIGFTTFNFGTMIRYKIILLPFYYYLLMHMYSDLKKTI